MLASNNKNWIIDSLFLLFFIGIFYFFGLGNHALFVPDEGRYSEIAREMIASHDFITPRLNGVAFLDKPILYYWLQASAIHFFGLNEWALRFWPAIFGIVGSLSLYFMGRMIFNRGTGLLAAILLATSPIYYSASHYANLDLEVAVLITLTLLSILGGIQTQNSLTRSRFFLCAWIFCGLAFLTKGLIGIVFPLLVSGIWILFTQQWFILKKAHFILGPIIFLMITLPWYILVQKANPEFLHFFFVTQQFSRFLSHTDFNNRAPFWFYIPIIILGFLPWSTFVIQSFFYQIKKISKKFNEHGSILFLFIWFFVVFIFFSIPTSKTIGYILPTFPPLALLTANYLYFYGSNPSRQLMSGWILFFIFCWIVLPILTLIQWFHHLPIAAWLTSICVLLIAISCFMVFILKSNKPAYLNIILFILSSIIFCLLFSMSAQYINPNSTKPIAIELKKTLQPTDEIVTYYSFYQDLILYLKKPVTIVADWESPDIAIHDNWVRELWYGMPFQDTHKFLINQKTFWEKWHSHTHRVIVIMDKKRFNDFKKHAGPLPNVKTFKDIVWVTSF